MKHQNGFRELELDQKVTLIGQALTVLASAFLSFGQIIKLLRDSALPTYPLDKHIQAERSERRESKHSYFN